MNCKYFDVRRRPRIHFYSASTWEVFKNLLKTNMIYFPLSLCLTFLLLHKHLESKRKENEHP